MTITLSSERIQLRELCADDWPAIHAYSQLPEVCRYQAWGPNTPEQTRAFVDETVATATQTPRVTYAFAAVVPASDQVIGMGTLHLRSQAFRTGEISCGLHPTYWGRGLGTDIGRLLLAFGFEELGLHRIQGTCDPRNVGSARIMQKLGMRYEGRMRETMLIRDGWRDSDLYSILDCEWAMPDKAPPTSV